jgi:hypothetical protein
MDPRSMSKSLFVRRGHDGSKWEFASLSDGGCALLRDGRIVAAGAGSDEAVRRLLAEFFGWTSGGGSGPLAGATSPGSGGPSPHAA